MNATAGLMSVPGISVEDKSTLENYGKVAVLAATRTVDFGPSLRGAVTRIAHKVNNDSDYYKSGLVWSDQSSCDSNEAV